MDPHKKAAVSQEIYSYLSYTYVRLTLKQKLRLPLICPNAALRHHFKCSTAGRCILSPQIQYTSYMQPYYPYPFQRFYTSVSDVCRRQIMTYNSRGVQMKQK